MTTPITRAQLLSLVKIDRLPELTALLHQACPEMGGRTFSTLVPPKRPGTPVLVVGWYAFTDADQGNPALIEQLEATWLDTPLPDTLPQQLTTVIDSAQMVIPLVHKKDLAIQLGIFSAY